MRFLEYNVIMVKIGKVIVYASVIVAVVGLVNVACGVSDNFVEATTSGLTATATIEPSMTMTISSTDEVLNINPSSEGSFGATDIMVGVYSNGSVGYTLTMTPSSTSLVGASNSIPTLVENSSCYGGWSCSSYNGFPAGYWGIAINDDAYGPVETTNLVTVLDTNTDTVANEYSIYFGVNLDLATAVDSYSTTIDFAATPTIRSYNAAFNFDNGVDSITIKNLEGTSIVATVSPSGGDVDLDYATSYLIIPNYASGQGLDTMSVTGAGNLTGNILTMGAGDSEITISSKNTSATVKSIEDVNYMQQFASITSAELTAVKESMALNTQYQLMDNRDNKTYYVAKLADGNVWMTQNLDHSIVSTTDFYTYYNTDIGHGSTPDINATWTGVATRATDDTTWSGSANLPESYDPGNLCWTGSPHYSVYIGVGATEDCNGGIAGGYGTANHRKIGEYYNWTAAVAMTSFDYRDYWPHEDVDQSICPAGWRLPTYEGDKSYRNLIDVLNVRRPNAMVLYDAPTYFIYGGDWNGENNLAAESGFYWTSAFDGGDGALTDAYHFNFTTSGSNNPQAIKSRAAGLSVRCVAR